MKFELLKGMKLILNAFRFGTGSLLISGASPNLHVRLTSNKLRGGKTA